MDKDQVLSKQKIYESLILQIDALFEKETDRTANLSNLVAILKDTTLPFFWIGFYIVKDRELVLGPFQGLPATSRIAFGLGVCGTCWKERKTQLVPDVHQFEGHIACNLYSKSEVVVPVIVKDEIVAVLDIDSDKKDDFDQTDVMYLEKITAIVSQNWKK